jgi:hypothetical protein
MVAVRMVSEGVDVPRLAVGVYATSVSTALFFAQAVGRFVRVRQRGETASVFVPSVPVLLGFAAELEAERDHVVHFADRDPEAELEAAQRERKTDDFEIGGRSFEALKASATFDRVLFDGGEFGTATIQRAVEPANAEIFLDAVGSSESTTTGRSPLIFRSSPAYARAVSWSPAITRPPASGIARLTSVSRLSAASSTRLIHIPEGSSAVRHACAIWSLVIGVPRVAVISSPARVRQCISPE